MIAAHPVCAALMGAALLVLPSGCAAPAAISPDYAVTEGISPADYGVHVRESWTPAGHGPEAPVFLTIINRTTETVGLVGVVTEGEGSGAVQQVVLRDGRLREAPVEGAVELPAGSSLSMGPRTTHLRVWGLTRPRRAGEELRLWLTMSDGSRVPVRVPVKAWAAGEP